METHHEQVHRRFDKNIGYRPAALPNCAAAAVSMVSVPDYDGKSDS
jgi:hypothetical protein